MDSPNVTRKANWIYFRTNDKTRVINGRPMIIRNGYDRRNGDEMVLVDVDVDKGVGVYIRSVVRGSGFSEARRESHIRTQTRRMKSYGSRTCGLESPSNLTLSKALLGPPGDCSAGQPR